MSADTFGLFFGDAWEGVEGVIKIVGAVEKMVMVEKYVIAPIPINTWDWTERILLRMVVSVLTLALYVVSNED